MAQFSVTGSQYNFLQIHVNTQFTDNNGSLRSFSNLFDFMWNGTGAAPAVGQKSALVTTAGTGFKAGVAALLLAAWNPAVTLVSYYVRWMDVYTDTFTVITDGSVGTGTAGDCLPARNSVTVRKNTGFRGKTLRGSWHFSGISEADTTKSELTGTGVANWATNLKPALLLSISDGTSTFVPVLISGVKGGTIIGPPPMAQTIAGAALVSPLAVNKAIGSMKRRREKGYVTV